MLDDIIELVLEIIFEGVFEGIFEGASSRKVPKVLRVLLVMVLLILYFGVCGVIFWIGLDNNDIVPMVVAMLLFVVIGVFVICKIRNMRGKR